MCMVNECPYFRITASDDKASVPNRFGPAVTTIRPQSDNNGAEGKRIRDQESIIELPSVGFQDSATQPNKFTVKSSAGDTGTDRRATKSNCRK